MRCGRGVGSAQWHTLMDHGSCIAYSCISVVCRVRVRVRGGEVDLCIAWSLGLT